MLYIFKLTVPKQTPISNPIRKDIEIPKGVIEKVIITIPFGHMSVAGMQIRYGEVVVMPQGEENWIYGNNEIIEDVWYWEIEKDKEIFTLVGYNNSKYHEHSFVVKFLVVPSQLVPPEIMPLKLEKEIKKLMGEEE
jgi:hypothetical protein